MSAAKTFLVLGASGGTGRHFLALALRDGHRVRALARTPAKLAALAHADLLVAQGSITDVGDAELAALVRGADCVVCMLGDAQAQAARTINADFVRRLVPAMRAHGVKRLLYQAGGFSTPHGRSLPFVLWLLKHTIARFGGFVGQHADNEAVMAFLAEDAKDVEWIVHRAGIYGDGPSKGTLVRSESKFSVGVHADAAAYNYSAVTADAATFALHTMDTTCYA